MTALYQRRRGDDRLAPACEWEGEPVRGYANAAVIVIVVLAWIFAAGWLLVN